MLGSAGDELFEVLRKTILFRVSCGVVDDLIEQRDLWKRMIRDTRISWWTWRRVSYVVADFLVGFFASEV